MKKQLNIYLISQDENVDYDTYDSCVVLAKDEESARGMNPGCCGWCSINGAWCSSPDKVTVTLIGKAKSDSVEGFVLKSFNAG